MRTIFLFVFLSITSLQGSTQEITTAHYKEDFQYFWKTINDYYSYWNKKKTDWIKVKEIYSPQADTITSRRSFVLLLEKVFYELYDHHASLNTNTPESQRLVPSGTDIWAAFINNKPTITEVRHGFGAFKSGLTAGMEIIAFNDVPIHKAIEPFIGKALNEVDNEVKNYALRVLLAGKHSEKRKITVRHQNKLLQFYPDEPVNLLKEHKYSGDIESNITNNIGYLRVNNSLWDNNLIPLFDSVLQTLKNSKALIIDLRETPSGGNTTVARAILGSFISKEGFYQKHELTVEEKEFGIKRSWVEVVSPRKYIYQKPLILLVNHWTGSVGEGITIGFDAFKRATIIGTELAGLNGAIFSFTMPNTKIGFSIPAEKLFHVNGTPRENFKPAIQVNLTNQKPTEDKILQMAVNHLLRLK